MYSKILRVVLVLPFVLSTSCGLNTGEKAPKSGAPAFSGRGYVCVGEIPQHLGRYVSDELSETDITDFVRCLQKAFTTFTQLTRGRDVSVYKPEEIRDFLQTYFLRERPITDQFLHEFMVLKQAFAGGTLDTITRPEIAELIDFLEDLRREAIRLKPHLQFLNPVLIKNRPVQVENLGPRLQLASEALRDSIRVVAKRLQKGQQEYRFSNFENLITEFRRFVRWDEVYPEALPPRFWIQFLRVFKQMIVSPDNNETIKVREWTPFLHGLSRWYLAYVQYLIGVQHQPKFNGAGLKNFMFLAREAFDLAEEAVARQPDQRMSMLQMNNLFRAAQDLGWVSMKVRSNSLEQTFRTFVGRVFGDVQSGLDLETLSRMKFEFYRWANIQLRLDAQFAGRAVDPVSDLIPNTTAGFIIPAEFRARLRQVHEQDWQDFMNVREKIRPMFNSDWSRTTLVTPAHFDKYGLNQGFYNLTMMNILRTMVGLVFKGYSSQKQVKWDSTLRREELQRFYLDVRELAIDLGVADSRVTTVGNRAFIEGNLFTFSGDGISQDDEKSRLTFVETTELLSLLYSGGRMAGKLYEELAKVSSKGPLDLHGTPTLDRTKVKENLARVLREQATNLPGLVDFLSRSKPEIAQDMADKILAAAFSPRNSLQDWVEMNELSIVAVVFHYIEAVMVRYDKNGDGILDNDEIRRAIPVFTGFIQKFAKESMKMDLSDSRAEGVFLYLLAYKTIPTTQILNKLSVWWLSSDRDYGFDVGCKCWLFEWDGFRVPLDFNTQITLDRMAMTSVFQVIVEKLFATSAASAPAVSAPSH
ncbi:MAG: hypothetical protein AB7F86_11250 [Bdellovibrionales bacterium]